MSNSTKDDLKEVDTDELLSELNRRFNQRYRVQRTENALKILEIMRTTHGEGMPDDFYEDRCEDLRNGARCMVLWLDK